MGKFMSRALWEDKHEFVTTFLDHAVVNIEECMKELKKRSTVNFLTICTVVLVNL